jgi:hypothetical protein
LIDVKVKKKREKQGKQSAIYTDSGEEPSREPKVETAEAEPAEATNGWRPRPPRPHLVSDVYM